jgi:AGZA family xanthine/uracil permease-like MFS transporter
LASNLDIQANGFLIHGMNIMQQGYIFTSMILAAIASSLIDRKFGSAALWSFLAAVLSFIGIIHAYQLSGNAIHFLFIGMQAEPHALAFPATKIALGYLLISLMLIGFWLRVEKSQK